MAVTLAVIGLLLSLAVPAIHRTRESARRVDCQNRQRQLALAIHNFEQAHRHLPGPCFASTSTPAFPRMLSEWARILPFMDQSAIYNKIDFDPQESGARAYPGAPSLVRSRNQQLLETRLPIVLCPSEQAPGGSCNARVCHGTMPRVSRNPQAPEDAGRRGILSDWPVTRPPTVADAKDGLSNTVLLSERLTGDFDTATFSPHRDIYYLTKELPVLFSDTEELESACASRFPSTTVAHTSYAGATWLLAGEDYTAYNHVLPPNARVPDCANSNSSPLSQGAVSARSWHAGGVNAAFGDGSVRFVAQSISLSVWQAVSTRAGGELVSDF